MGLSHSGSEVLVYGSQVLCPKEDPKIFPLYWKTSVQLLSHFNGRLKKLEGVG